MMKLAQIPFRRSGRILAAILVLLVVTSAGAQTLRLADLDLSAASIHQAGPTSFYVRGVVVDDETYSMLIEQDSSLTWTVTTIQSETSNILPPDTILDFATISVEGESITIEGVLVGDSIYGGSLAVGEDADLVLAEAIRTATNESVNSARSQALRAIIEAETEATFRDQLEAQRLSYEAQLEELRAERDRLEEELASLPGAAVAEPIADPAPETIEPEPDTPDPATASSPLSGEEVEALLFERDQLAGDIVGLVMENNELRSERRVLRDQITELQARNAELLEDVSSMDSEVNRLQELVDAFRSATRVDTSDEDGTDVGEEESVPAEPAASWAFPGDYVRASDLEAAAQAVSLEIRSLESRVAALEVAAQEVVSAGLAPVTTPAVPAESVTAPAPEPSEEPSVVTTESDEDSMPTTDIASTPVVEPVQPFVPTPEDDSIDLSFGPFVRPEESASDVVNEPATPAREDVAEEPQEPVTREDAVAALDDAAEAARLAELQAEVAALLAENAQLRREQRAIEDRILNEILGNGFVRMMESRLTESVVSGFSASAPDTGAWNVTDGRAIQADEEAFFAKLAMPVEQSDNPVLYSFSARSLDEGWVGVGLHLFVSGVERRAGYGMGSSLLVWFTRDPEARGDSATYLQVYRSDDDVDMARVLDAAIPESVDEFMDVDVLYEPTNQYITIAVNGVDRVRYRTWFGIDSGVELALRTLGRAEFTNFAVATEQ